MRREKTMSLGELISLFYEEFLSLYGDEELASVAAATAVNELLAERARREDNSEAAA